MDSGTTSLSRSRSRLERLFVKSHDIRHVLRSKLHVEIFPRSNASSVVALKPTTPIPPPTLSETASTTETLVPRTPSINYKDLWLRLSISSTPPEAVIPEASSESMPEFVWALHEFQPEAEDEIPFRSGERIEVIEKDEEYGDGWWQVRFDQNIKFVSFLLLFVILQGKNAQGRRGLFPQSYTTSVPPQSLEAPDTPSTPSASTSATTITPSPEPTDGSPSNSIHHDQDGSSSTPLESLQEESEPETPAANSPTIPDALNTRIHGQEHGHDHDGDGEMMQATITDVQKAIEQLGRERRGSVNTFPNTDAQSFSFASDTGDSTDFGEEESDADRDSGDAEGGEGWHRDARLRLAEKARKAVEQAEKLESMMNTRSAPPIEVELSDESDMEDDGDPQDYTVSSFARRHSKIPEEDENDLESPVYKHPVETLPAIDEPQQESEPHVETPTRDIFVPPPVFSSLPTPEASESQSPSASPTPASTNGIRSDVTPNAASPVPDPISTPKTSEAPKGDPATWNVQEVVQWLQFKGFGEDVCEKFTGLSISFQQCFTSDQFLQSKKSLVMFCRIWT
jgi:hypothetical protein